jgi:hypothetical protein
MIRDVYVRSDLEKPPLTERTRELSHGIWVWKASCVAVVVLKSGWNGLLQQ